MRKGLDALLDRQADIAAELRQIDAAAEGREKTDEELTQQESLVSEAETIAGRIKAEERKDAVVAAMVTQRRQSTPPDDDPVPGAITSDEPAFRSFGEQLRAVALASAYGDKYPREREAAVNRLNYAQEALNVQAAAAGMSQGVPAEGGYTVLPRFSASIWARMQEDADSLLAATDSYTVQGESLTLLGIDETSKVRGSRFGGMQAFWIEEAGKPDYSKLKFRRVKVEPHELAVLVPVTDKLLRNSDVALEQWVSRAAADSINFEVGDAIWEGNGTGKPLGLKGHASIIAVAKETGQAADTIVEENIAKMYNRLHPALRSGAAWYINNDCQPQLDLMARTVKNVAGTENVGGFDSPLYNRDNNTLKGLPVRVIEYAETVGDLGDITLANLNGYLTGVRGGIDSAMSVHVLFETAQSLFRFMFEVDGQPWVRKALTPFKGSTTTSWAIQLAARA